MAVNGDLFVFYLTGAGYLIAGIWTIARRKQRPRATGWAFLYCVAGCAWAALAALDRQGRLGNLTPEFRAHLSHYGVYLLAALLYLLTRVLMGRSPGRVALPAGLLWGIFVTAIETGLLRFSTVLALPAGRTLGPSGAVILLLGIGWAVFLALATLAVSQAVRSRARFYTLATYLAVALLGMALSGGLVLAGQPGMGALVGLAAALPLTYTVTHSHLPEIGFSLRQLSGYLLFTAVAAGLYAAAILALQLFFPGWARLNPLASSLIPAVVLAVLFAPSLARLQKWVRRHITRGRPNFSDTLRRYSQNITNILDMDRLAAVAVGAASEIFDVRQGFLFLVNSGQSNGENGRVQLRGVKGMGNEPPADGALAAGSALAAWFHDAGRPLTQMEIDTHPHFSSLASDERAWLEALGAEVYLPIYAKNEWIGLLTLGPKGSGAEYTHRDLALLSTLADQTAVALENIRLVEGLMRLNNDFRRAYAALDQANQHLERLDKTKSDFISIASHELRTPLTLINGASQMMLDDPELPENSYYQQLLQKIKTGGDRLHEIVETMLDVAKIDQRTLDLEPQPVSMMNLIQGVCADLKSASAGRNQTIDVDLPNDLPSVMADMLALRKVFYHLISNAIKYTPDMGRITITGRRLEPNVTDLPHGGVEVVVSDTGIGIDPRFHELIFAKFYQTGELALHSTGKTKFKGSGPGLGLAIARGIVQAHHGRIWVESPGYDEDNCPGSRFHVVLPTRPSDRPLPPSPMVFKP